MKEKILEICRDLCCKELSEDEELIQSGLLDSFKLMELICSLEEEFDITFFPEEISKLDNFFFVNKIDNFIAMKIQKSETT